MPAITALGLFVREHRLGVVCYAPLDVLLSKHDIVLGVRIALS
jgi:hypothetical protein